jgi:hypothetical protein
VDLPPSLAARPKLARSQVPAPYVNETVGGDGTSMVSFRFINPDRARECGQRSLCGLCAAPHGPLRALLGGAFAAAVGLYADPPMHPSCAEAALLLCPHLRVRSHSRDGKPHMWVLGVTDDVTMHEVGDGVLFSPAAFHTCRYFRYRDNGLLTEDLDMTRSVI